MEAVRSQPCTFWEVDWFEKGRFIGEHSERVDRTKDSAAHGLFKP